MLPETFTHTNQFLLVLDRQVVYADILPLELQLQEETTRDFLVPVCLIVSLASEAVLMYMTLQHRRERRATEVE